MDFVDNSNHMCLICNQAIVGLLNYVEHFKTHATPQESHIVEQKVNANEVRNSLSSRGNNSSAVNKNLGSDNRHNSNQHKESGTFSGDTSPLSEFIDNTDDFADPDIGTEDLLSPKHCTDFFQSLELKSANEEAPPRPKIKAVQRLSILEDDAHAESLLPITSILSNLDFSSDEEFLGVSDNEEGGMNDDTSWLSDDGEERMSTHPPHGHTGGKWKPGEGPKRRLPIAGKWKPGHGPGPACRKNILRKPPKVRGGKNDIGKTFYCNVCLSYFSDRNSYSMHFSQPQHKEIAEAKKQEKTASTTDYLEEEHRIDEEQVHAEQHRQELAVTASTEVSNVKLKRGTDEFYCPVCDLYFDNAIVFSTHCETKVHKDALLRRGYREYKGSDGTIIRIDIINETIHKEKPENWWTTLDPLRSTSLINQSKEPDSHECHICQKHFARKYEMARHLLTRMHRSRALKHPEAESVEMLNKYNKYMIRLSPFQCGVCQFYFNRQRDFLDHMGSESHLRTCEDMLGPVMCMACKYKTHKHNEMMEHLQYPEHLAAVEKRHGVCIVRESHTRITCKFCGVRMHSAVRMKRHCQQRHSDRLTEVQVTMDVKPVEYNLYNCPLCQKAFRAKSLLQLHFLKIHKNTAMFNCKDCNRGFLDQRRLDNHLRTRFHARRVIANKVSGAHRMLTAALKNSVAMEGIKRKGRGSHKKREPGKAAVVKSPKPKVAGQPPKPEVQTDTTFIPRRSTRKRKRMEFFDDEDSDKEKEKKKKEKVAKVQKAPAGPKVKVSFGKNKTWTVETTGTESLSPGIKVEIKRSDGNVVEVSSQNNATVVQEENTPGSHTVNITEENEQDKTYSNQPTVNGVMNNSSHHVYENGLTEEEENCDVDDDDDYSLEGDENGEEHQEEVDEETLNEASKTIFSCTYCEFAATDLTELRGHYNENHPNDILTCQPCNQYFLSLKAYKIHCSGRGHQLKLREQSGETKMHKCKMCDKRFLQESCCLLHMETVHRHPSCEADLQRIHKGQDLVTQLYGDHVKQVESLSNDTSVSCPECGKFVRKDTLVEHLRLHTGERPYACRFCSKGFAGRLTLRRHISSHLNMPTFMCDFCGKEFKRNSHLIKHIRQHDFEKKGEKHSCHVCSSWFYTPEELARHMKRHGDRNFKCTWPGCHWTFVLSGELKSHMFTHTGEKKYLCDMCGFGAPTKTRLRRHVKTHDKARNFTCDYCPYKATCKTHLKRHMRIHINARPFACPYCTYTCNTHENIRKHILKTQKHKGMKLYPCKLCGNFGCDSSKDFRGHLMTVHADYLRENAVDSLAVFSGLYKREEDFQKPKEGSEIIQVTKGRFFRSYQNPDAPIEPPKPKKVKKVKKMEEVKVIIVPPSELEMEDNLRQDHVSIENQQEPFQQPHPQQQQQQQQQQQEQHVVPQQLFLHSDLQHEQQQQHQEPQQEEEQTEVVNGEVEAPQYLEVPNMVIHSYDPQHAQQLATVSFSSPTIQHQQVQPQAQQLPVTVTVSDDKVFWTVVPEQRVESASASQPTAEPWYSGMPQVHAPTSQELQQYRSVEVTTSHAGQFLPSSYFCNIPVGEIQSIQSAVGAQIYSGVVENVVVLSDPTRPETTIE